MAFLNPRYKSITASILLLASISARAQVDVTTWHNDLARTGVNAQETILTTQNVNANEFGRLYKVPTDGQAYAQPLYLHDVEIAGGTHNVVYVATQHNSVYVFDADSGTQYAQVNLTPPGGTTASVTDLMGCGDINPEVGITGTPVIDRTTNTLYVVAKSKVNGSIVQHLHALDTSTLEEKLAGPVEIQASSPGRALDGDGTNVWFNPQTALQRPGLALVNGHVLITFASHCDIRPYHGWVMSYSAATLDQEAVWNAAPNGEPNSDAEHQVSHAGIWMSGAAPSIDAEGNIYVITGNGYWNGTSDFGDSVVKLGPPANGTFPVLDYFTPFDQQNMSNGDVDLGSTAATLLPRTAAGEDLLVLQAKGSSTSGRGTSLYVLDRKNLGKSCALQSPPCTDRNPQIRQEILGATPGALSSAVVWNHRIFWNARGNSPVRSWSFDEGGSTPVSPLPVSQTALVAAANAGSSLSANGTTNGIYWIIHNTGEMRAYDALDLTRQIYTTSDAPNGRDNSGGAVKFAPPTIANGKVYLANQNSLVAYGLLNGKATTPTFSPPGGTYTSPQTVTISNTTPFATYFYTTNGTTPTTGSTRYTAPITVSASMTIRAMAVADGLAQSDVASASYIITNSTPPTAAVPTFSPGSGTYTSAQSVSISDATPGAVIHYTTDGSTPTASSPVYSGSISVTSTQTLKAIATANGFSPSAVATAVYTITTGGGTTPPVNYPGGFPDATGLTLVGDATVSGGTLQLTDGGNFENRTAWFSTPVNIAAFTTDFSFQITPADPNSSDGMTFTIQNMGLTARGGVGGGLGYQDIKPSVAVKFDLWDNNGEGKNSTGFYTGGVAPTVPALDLTGTIDLHSGHVMHAKLSYDGTTLTLALTDTVTGATYQASQAINIPQTVGGSTAYVGFTAGTGGTVATHSILDWTFASVAPPPTTALPTFSPAAGTYTSAQSVSIADATPNAVIHFTTDGSTPTTSSPVYSGPIAVTSTRTLKAMAVANGFSPSGVATAVYLIASGGTHTLVNYPTGFPDATGLTLVGDSTVSGGTLQLTDGGNFENRTAWFSTPVSIAAFTTDFSFQITPADPNSSDGMTFTIQNMGLTARGGVGGALGYQDIKPSVAVKFDLWDNNGEGKNSTGFYTGGVAPTVPALDLTGTIDLHSGHVMHAKLTYDGTMLTLVLTDTVTGAAFEASQAIDIPAAVGGSTAYVGFTAGTGGTVATHSILNWTYATAN